VTKRKEPTMESKKFSFNLENLGCANCAAKMEKKLKSLDGIDEVQINFVMIQRNLAVAVNITMMNMILAAAASITMMIMILAAATNITMMNIMDMKDTITIKIPHHTHIIINTVESTQKENF